MRIFKPGVLIGLAVVLGMTGCKADKCEERPAEAQIDVVLDGITPDEIKDTDVKLTINNARSFNLYFDVSAPSFVFEFEDWDKPPRELTIQVMAADGEGRVLGTGETKATFSSDGCNFFSVTVRPGAVSDAGPDAEVLDGGPPDAAQLDSDMAVPGTWVEIPPSGTTPPVTFSMGSPDSESCRYLVETQHKVTLTRAFKISAFEVTQGEFQALMGYNPSSFTSCGGDCPVDDADWHDAAAYCNALSDQAGLDQCYSCSGSGSSITCSEASAYSGQNVYDCPGYRLPTEAEWEYAYRAGSSTAFYPSSGNNGTITVCWDSSDPNADKIGRYRYNCGVSYAGCYDLSSSDADACSGPHPRGTKAPNAWGLYDMAGNVWEWCHDWYKSVYESLGPTDPWGSATGSSRVMRGGSWYFNAGDMRAASRRSHHPTFQVGNLGFRCGRTN